MENSGQLHPPAALCWGNYAGTYIGGWVELIAGLGAVQKRKAENKTLTIQPLAWFYTCSVSAEEKRTK
jgi:hypothetical protein